MSHGLSATHAPNAAANSNTYDLTPVLHAPPSRETEADPGLRHAQPAHVAAWLTQRPQPPAQQAGLLRHLQHSYGNRFVGSVIQRRPAAGHAAGGAVADARLAARLRATQGGAELEAGARARLERGLGTNLAGVRVHTDGEADELAQAFGAVAFTHGADIYFRAGVYKPETAAGMRLLAHEAAHVSQQTGGAGPRAAAPDTLSVSEPGDALEQLADRGAERVVRGLEAPASSSGAQGGAAADVQRQVPTPVTPSESDELDRFRREQEEQKRRGAVSEADRSFLWNVAGLIPGGSAVSAAVDTAKMVYYGISGDNEKAASSGASAAINAVGMIPIVGQALSIYGAGIDAQASKDRAAGVAPEKAPLSGDVMTDYLIRLMSIGTEEEHSSWDVHEEMKKKAAE
jgi:hypothetical protein